MPDTRPRPREESDLIESEANPLLKIPDALFDKAQRFRVSSQILSEIAALLSVPSEQLTVGKIGYTRGSGGLGGGGGETLLGCPSWDAAFFAS